MSTSKLRVVVALLFFLGGSRALGQSADLQKLLDRTGREVTAFLDQVSDVRCTEQVTQQKLNRKGHPEVSEVGTYDYLVLLSGGDDELQLNESRLATGAERPVKNASLLISNGFSMLFLIFHPFYRSSFRFEPEPDGTINGQRYLRIHFSHVEGARTPAALAVRGREYPLDLEGTAWIDPATGMVARIEAVLEKDLHDVGLRSLSAEIAYEPVTLPGWDRVYRFPVEVTVEVETLRQHWRNVHRFSHYQRFMVDTQESVSNNTGKK